MFKLITYLTLQSIVGFLLWRYLHREGVVREALITFFALLFFAGIGLTGQVFHLESDGYSSLFFWSALTLPITLLSKSRPINFIWLIVLMTAHCIWLAVKVGNHIGVDLSVRYLWFSGLTLYAYLALGVFKSLQLNLPANMAEAMRVLPFLIILLGGSALGTILWYTDMDVALVNPNDEMQKFLRLQALPWVGAGIVALAVFLRRPALDKPLQISLVALLAALALFVTLPVAFALPAHRALGATLSMVVWAIAGVAAVYGNQRRVFDAITLCITIRLLIVYFEVFGSLMATGVGLIISGMLILGVTRVWYRYRMQLAGWIRRAV